VAGSGISLSLGLGGGKPSTSTSGSGGGGGVSEPALTADDATNVTINTATLSADITSTGGEDPVITLFYGLRDREEAVALWDEEADLGAQGVGTATKNISGLDVAELHYFRFRAVNSAGTVWTAPSKTFTTLFAISTNTLAATILARTGDPVGFVAYATDEDAIYIKNSSAVEEWRSFSSTGSI